MVKAAMLRDGHGKESCDVTMEYSEQPGQSEDESLRQTLEGLDKDQADLDRLKNMLAGWRFEPDIFRELGLDHREDVHSRFLAWLLDPQGSHGLEDHFLRSFLFGTGVGSGELKAEDRRGIKVTCEKGVEQDGSQGRLDIQILSEGAQFLCVVENKVWADEGVEQLSFYRRALDEKYRDYRIHRVFLTPKGRPSNEQEENEHWTRMSYTDILRLVEQTINDKKGAARQDVLAFLAQYAITLRRNIVPDVTNDVHQLAQTIYRKHQKAIDLITDYKDRYAPKYVTEATQMFRDAIADRQQIWRPATSNRSYLRFTSVDWARFESLKLTRWPDSLLLFEIHITYNSTSMKLSLVGGGDEVLRRKIYNRVKENPEIFNCEVPTYKDGLIELHLAGEILEACDYEDWWDEKAIRATITKRLDEFVENPYPRINEVILQCLEEHEAGRD